MNKILLVLIVCMVAFGAKGQDLEEFSLTKNGFVDKQDIAKDYLIVSFPGKNKEDLYKAFLHFVLKNYNSPKFVTDKVENASIRIAGEVEYYVGDYKTSFLDKFKCYIDKYIILAEFKDEKMKVSIPSINWRSTGLINNGYNFHINGNYKKNSTNKALWDNEGNFNKKWEFLLIPTEVYFNNYIKLLISEMSNQDDW